MGNNKKRARDPIFSINRILEQCISIPKPLTLVDATTLVNWFEKVECYELVNGSLEEAVNEIESLIA